MNRIQQILDKAERERRDASHRPAWDRAGRLRHRSARRRGRLTIDIPTTTADAGTNGRTQHRARGVPPLRGPVASKGISARGRDRELLRPSELAARRRVSRPKSAAAEQYRQFADAPVQGADGANNLADRAGHQSLRKARGKVDHLRQSGADDWRRKLHRKVAIVEADLRKPSMAAAVSGLPPGPGLTDHLAGGAELTEVMQFLPDHKPDGDPPPDRPAVNPAELAGLDRRCAGLLERAPHPVRSRQSLDTTARSSLPLADGRGGSHRLVDGVLMVVRRPGPSRPKPGDRKNALPRLRLRRAWLGIVLNDSGHEQDYRYEATRQLTPRCHGSGPGAIQPSAMTRIPGMQVFNRNVVGEGAGPFFFGFEIVLISGSMALAARFHGGFESAAAGAMLWKIAAVTVFVRAVLLLQTTSTISPWFHSNRELVVRLLQATGAADDCPGSGGASPFSRTAPRTRARL